MTGQRRRLKAGPLPDPVVKDLLASLERESNRGDSSRELAFLEGRVERLPLPLVRGLPIQELEVRGALASPPSREDAELFLNVLPGRLGAVASVRFGIDYEDAGSPRHGSNCDCARMIRADQPTTFSYSAGGSLVSRGPDYRRRFFRRVVAESGLPVSLEETEEEFFVRDLEGKPIHTPISGSGGSHPSAFHLPINPGSAEEALSLIEHWAARFARDRVRWTWGIWLARGENGSAVCRVVQALADASVPGPFDVFLGIFNTQAGCFRFLSDFIEVPGRLKLMTGKLRSPVGGRFFEITGQRRAEGWTLKTRVSPEEQEALDEILGTELWE